MQPYHPHRHHRHHRRRRHHRRTILQRVFRIGPVIYAWRRVLSARVLVLGLPVLLALGFLVYRLGTDYAYPEPHQPVASTAVENDVALRMPEHEPNLGLPLDVLFGQFEPLTNNFDWGDRDARLTNIVSTKAPGR